MIIAMVITSRMPTGLMPVFILLWVILRFFTPQGQLVASMGLNLAWRMQLKVDSFA